VNPRRSLLLVATALALVVVGFGAVGAVRDTTPPELWLELPERFVAGESFEVSVSSSKPVTLSLAYGDQQFREVTEVLTATLIARPGRQSLRVLGVDAAGREAELTREIDGRWPLRAGLTAPPALEVGDPLLVWLRFEEPPSGVKLLALDRLELTLDGAPLPLLLRPDGWVSLSGVALASEPGNKALRLAFSDELGRSYEVQRSLIVRANPRPVDLVPLGAETLSLITPEARELEAAAYAAALAEVPPEPRWSEPFLLPVAGRTSSPFGDPRRYGLGGVVSYHLGTDIAAPVGTPVVATNDGVVRVAGFYPIKGGWVVLDHGQGLTSHHFHLSSIEVTVGDVAARGEVIARVGSTGLSTGPHLHWEMRLDGVPTEPLWWVGQRYPMVERP
jgi:murein DD-endopeptidase MepM/ murein hydrolase activator NlpD